jgi:DUF1365 family protein
MELSQKIFHAKVFHKRFFPRENVFNYGIYYLAFPLSKINEINIPLNKFGLTSFYEKDHGAKDGSNLETWAKNLLKNHNINDIEEIILVSLPRILGYVFNPVSFYFCYDKNQNLKAVINEVNNTFGETHIYICFNQDFSTITENNVLEAEKIFHVSPFLERCGFYKFRYSSQEDKLAIWIDYFDDSGKKMLATSLIGGFEYLSSKSAKRAFWRYPLVTLKAILLIHYQAIKLVMKKIKYVKKPVQKNTTTSTSK